MLNLAHQMCKSETLTSLPNLEAGAETHIVLPPQRFVFGFQKVLFDKTVLEINSEQTKFV